MKKIILTVIFTVTIFANSINWITDIKKAQKKAEKEHKIILVFIEAENCPWCERMKKETFSSIDVIRNINKDYIALKVDANSKNGITYFKNISTTPTTIFYTPKGEILEILEGFQNEEFLFWAMTSAENKFKSK